MKRKVLSFVLVMTMLMSYSPFTFAEGLDLEGSSEVVQENIEENEDIIVSNEVDLGNEDLDADNEQISSDSEYEIEEDTGMLEVDTEVVEGSEEPSNSTEGTTPSTDSSGSEETVEGDTEGLEEDTDIDDGFGVENEDTDIDNGFGVDSEDTDIDSSFGIDSEETDIGSMDIEDAADTEDSGITTGDVYIDPSQDDSGYIVYETPEGAYEGLDINGPTATIEPNEEIDPGYTISAEEEAQGYAVPREPLIFKISEGLTLYRAPNGSIATSDFVSTNSTGVDICLIGVEVVPINGWSMVGYNVDFKNMKADTREFRLTVNNQVILDYDGDGFIPMNNPLIYFDGEEICIPMDLEIGPFKNGLNEGLFSFALVFEEIIKEEPIVVESEEIQAENKEVVGESQEIVEETQEGLEEIQEEIQEEVADEQEPTESEDLIEDMGSTSDEADEVVNAGTDAEVGADNETASDLPASEEMEDTVEDETLLPDAEIDISGDIEGDAAALDGVEFTQATAELAELETQIEPYPFEGLVESEQSISKEEIYIAPDEEESVVEDIPMVLDDQDENEGEEDIENIEE